MAAEELAVFQPSTARKLLAMLQAWERTPGFTGELESHAYREHFPFLNSSGHTIPPYGIFLVDGTSEANGMNYLIAKRYASWTAAQSVPMVNGPFEVPDGEYGSPQLGPVYRVVHDDAITYSVGDRVGWKADSFQVALNAAFINLGDDDIVAGFSPSCRYVRWERSENVVVNLQPMQIVCAMTLGISQTGQQVFSVVVFPVRLHHQSSQFLLHLKTLAIFEAAFLVTMTIRL